MSTSDDRMRKILQRAERRERLENKLGIGRMVNMVRDEHNLNTADRRERKDLRDRQREERKKLNSKPRKI